MNNNYKMRHTGYGEYLCKFEDMRLNSDNRIADIEKYCEFTPEEEHDLICDLGKCSPQNQEKISNLIYTFKKTHLKEGVVIPSTCIIPALLEYISKCSEAACNNEKMPDPHDYIARAMSGINLSEMRNPDEIINELLDSIDVDEIISALGPIVKDVISNIPKLLRSFDMDANMNDIVDKIKDKLSESAILKDLDNNSSTIETSTADNAVEVVEGEVINTKPKTYNKTAVLIKKDIPQPKQKELVASAFDMVTNLNALDAAFPDYNIRMSQFDIIETALKYGIKDGVIKPGMEFGLEFHQNALVLLSVKPHGQTGEYTHDFQLTITITSQGNTYGGRSITKVS